MKLRKESYGEVLINLNNLFPHTTLDQIKEMADVICENPEKQQKEELKERLKWLSERLINRYGENKNLDYHISAREL